MQHSHRMPIQSSSERTAHHCHNETLRYSSSHWDKGLQSSLQKPHPDLQVKSKNADISSNKVRQTPTYTSSYFPTPSYTFSKLNDKISENDSQKSLSSQPSYKSVNRLAEKGVSAGVKSQPENFNPIVSTNAQQGSGNSFAKKSGVGFYTRVGYKELEAKKNRETTIKITSRKG